MNETSAMPLGVCHSENKVWQDTAEELDAA